MEKLLGLLLNGESKYIEFKETYSKTILKTVSAFSNYHTGKIVIGISDTGRVVGVDNSTELRLRIENTLNDSIKPQAEYDVEIKVIENRDILIFTIFKGEFTPYTIDKKAYKRRDTSTVEVEKHAYDELVLLGRNMTYEELSYGDMTLTFKSVEQLLISELNITRLDENILKSLELLKNDTYNNAGALLAD